MIVYVAGLYSFNEKGERAHIGEVLNNMRRGMRIATELFVKGYNPDCPFLDYHYQLMMTEEEARLSIKQRYYSYSIAFRKRSDILLVISGADVKHCGVVKEIEKAKSCYIPIVYSTKELYERFPI